VAEIVYTRPPMYPEQEAAFFGPERFAQTMASTKAGKAQPLTEPVLTPLGWRPIGDLRVGDEVIGSDGTPTTVTAVHPQGIRPMMRVATDDGAWTVADPEHLWSVEIGPSRTPDLLTTAELLDSPRTYLPVVAPIERPHADLPLDPYTLGLLLGDGGMSADFVIFTNGDGLHESLVLPTGGYLVQVSDIMWGVRGINPVMRGLGLLGVKSVDKHIPEEYLRASVSQRRALLAGLLDTDGGMQRSSTSYYTSSPRMRDDVVALVRSLGGVAQVRSKTPTYTHQGQRRVGHEAYTVSVRLPAEHGNPFRLERKAQAWETGTTKRRPTRRVVTVEPAETSEAVCIEVDAPDHLYVTRNYLVTHNSYACLIWLLEQTMQAPEGWATWWIAPSTTQAKIMYRRMKRMIGGNPGVEVNETERTITLPNGSAMFYKTGSNPDLLYGEDVYAAVVDEAPRVRQDSWVAVYSTLTATGGSARLVGNMRAGWAYDLYQAVLAGRPGWTAHKITAWDAVRGGVLKKEIVEQAQRDLHPDMFAELYLADLRRADRFFQGSPRVVARSEIPESARWVRGWDFAASTPKPGRDPDFTCGVLMAVHGETVWVVDVVMGRWSPDEVFARFVATMRADGCDQVVEEEKGASGKILHSALKSAAVAAGLPNRVHSMAISGDKRTRAMGYARDFNLDRVRFVEGDWHDAVLDQYEAFPTPGVHDDAVDASSAAYNHLAGRNWAVGEFSMVGFHVDLTDEDVPSDPDSDLPTLGLMF
jgi:predicted phage terminase large subunit-like protein